MTERRRPKARGARKAARGARSTTGARSTAHPAKKRAKKRAAPARRKAAKTALKTAAAKTPAIKGAASKSSVAANGAVKAKRATKAVDPHAAVRRYRERMRAKGLRPVTIWVPDLRNPEVVQKLQADFAAIRQHELTSPQAREDAEFWEKVAAQAWDDLPDYDWGPDGPPKG